MRMAAALGLLVACTLVTAQEGSTYKVTEHTLNAGGHPRDGVILGSGSFLVTLDAIGDTVAVVSVSGEAYRVDAGFAPAYPPPTEVLNLRFTDDETLLWEANPAAGVYHLYRGAIDRLQGLEYGTCLQSAIVGTTASVPDRPPDGLGYYYLVTVANRLDEEGTKGFDNGMNERGNPYPCS